MPLVILHHLLNVSVQLANKRGLKKNKKKLILQAALDPRVHSASNRNAYQKQKNNVSGK
jgi:hypothetical protein